LASAITSTGRCCAGLISRVSPNDSEARRTSSSHAVVSL
jgi:hypothetical protein